MSIPTPYKGQCFEDVPITLRSYNLNVSGVAITRAATSKVEYLVKRYDSEEDAEDDRDATSILTLTDAGAVASIIYDTAQTWDVDSVGYNLQLTVSGTNFDTKGKFYVVEIWITPTSGEAFLSGPFILECLPTRKD